MGLVTGLAIGAAALGAGASAISSNSASKRAAATSQANTDANVGLARDIYGQNRALMTPFMQRGNVAGNQINALLGLGGSQMQGGPAFVGPNALSGGAFGGGSAASNYGLGDSPGFQFGGSGIDGNAYLQANPDVAAEFSRVGAQFGNDPNAFAQFHYNTYGQNEGRAMPGVTGTPGAATGQTAQEAANSAFDIFKQSSGYQNRFNSAMDGVTSAYSGIGAFQSGAAARALQDRAGQVAGEEFGNYMNALGNQQAVGAGSASALAGVGQNFAGTVIGANNFNAQNQMSAQLSRQNPLANMLGTIGGAGLGFLGGR